MIIEPYEIKNIDTEGKVVGITSGCFDLLHFYHLHYLQRCRAECDLLIVGVDSDALVAKTKKPPAIPEYQRVAMIDALGCVNASFVMRSMKDLEAACRRARAVSKESVIFKHSDTVYGKPVETFGCRLAIVPDVETPTSTTSIKNQIWNQERSNGSV